MFACLFYPSVNIRARDGRLFILFALGFECQFEAFVAREMISWLPGIG